MSNVPWNYQNRCMEDHLGQRGVPCGDGFLEEEPLDSPEKRPGAHTDSLRALEADLQRYKTYRTLGVGGKAIKYGDSVHPLVGEKQVQVGRLTSPVYLRDEEVRHTKSVEWKLIAPSPVT